MFSFARPILLILAILALSGIFAQTPEEVAPVKDDWKLQLGGHIRLRYNVLGDEGKDPTGQRKSGGKYKYGPHPSQYFESRSKVWLEYWSESLSLHGKTIFGNRSHYYLSDWDDPNNASPGHHSALDTLSIVESWVEFSDLGLEGLSLCVGRRPVILGNGMIMHDGVAFDWQDYFDGAQLIYRSESDCLRGMLFYNYWRDPLAIDLRWHRDDYASGDGRALNAGNVLTTGVYETHRFSDAFQLDAYYLYNNVIADHNGRKERAMPLGWDELNMHTVGVRLFGKFCPALSYSGEFAQQLGEWQKDGEDGSVVGNMTDWRLSWKLYETTDFLASVKPQWDFSYTYWRGDDGKGGTYDGWYSLTSSYWGLFGGEELSSSGALPCGSCWTNLHAFHTDFQVVPKKHLTLNLGSIYFRADVPSESGRNLGVLVYGKATWKLDKSWEIKGILSHMFYGDYYGPDRQDGGFWSRIEVNYFF